MMKKQKLIVITGPTASGKTSLAEKLVKKFNGQIISADSRQIYKELNIGVNKEKLSIPQFLTDIIPLTKNFTLQDYKNLAIKAIAKTYKQGKIPFLTGGTPLYIYAVIDNWQIPQVSPQKSLRKKLEEKTIAELYKDLTALDPKAIIITGRNKRRLIRALEVVLTTNKKFSSQRKKAKPLYNVLIIGKKTNKEDLKKRIGIRTKKMLRAGLEKEVRCLIKKYGWELPAISAINYKEWQNYFENRIDKKELIELLNKNNIRYARKQMQWLKRDKRIKWVSNFSEAKKEVKQFLKP